MEALGFIFGAMGFIFGLMAYTNNTSTSGQVTQLTSQIVLLRIEHESLKKNLKELGVLKEE